MHLGLLAIFIWLFCEQTGDPYIKILLHFIYVPPWSCRASWSDSLWQVQSLHIPVWSMRLFWLQVCLVASATELVNESQTIFFTKPYFAPWNTPLIFGVWIPMILPDLFRDLLPPSLLPSGWSWSQPLDQVLLQTPYLPHRIWLEICYQDSATDGISQAHQRTFMQFSVVGWWVVAAVSNQWARIHTHLSLTLTTTLPVLVPLWTSIVATLILQQGGSWKLM